MNSANIKVSTKILIVLIVSMLVILSISFSPVNKANADAVNDTSLLEKCQELTENELFTVNNQTKELSQYKGYLNDRFQFDNKFFSTTNLEDEWILKIVPVEIFKEKKEFFYIGKTYGFYINYDSNTQTYLIYLLINQYAYCNGLLKREISPYYYEQYVFNETTEKVSLVYMEYDIYPDPQNPYDKIHYNHYRKHSDYEKLYLKDVNFTGSLYNENHLNIDESGYNPNQDNGGYFVQSQYIFKGVSTQSGKMDFANAILEIGLGYIPLGASGLTVGDVLNVATAITELKKHISNAIDDFRGTVSNESLYEFTEFSGMLRDEQINKFGKPLKNSATKFQTNNTKEAVLLGINSDNYARNEYLINYYNQSDMWNTRYVGNVSLDIVKEVSSIGGSTVTEIANDIQAIAPSSYTIDKGEETKISENEEGQLYILSDTRHRISFTAPENGIYTINTFGEIKNNIICQLGEVISTNDGVNKKLLLTLKKGQNIKVDVTRDQYLGSGFIGIFIRFTPKELLKGETHQIEIQPGESEFLLFTAEHKASPFNFNIEGKSEVAFQMAYNKYDNFLPNTISGINLVGSRLAEYEGKYYIIISNLSNESQIVSVSLSKIDSVMPDSKIVEDILDKKVYELSSIFTSSVKISVDSDAHILMQVFDVNHNLLSWTSNVSQKELVCEVESGEKYYVVISNLLYTNYSMELSFNLGGYTLSLGNNETSKSNEGMLAKFTTQDAKATYKIESNLILDIYDSEWNMISTSANNIFLLEANAIYHIYASGLASNVQINIELFSTSETSGIFPTSGIVFIRYTPSRTTAYKVTGINEVQWYNNLLIRQNAYLYAGDNYFLRLEGNPGEEYNVNILRNANQIQTNASLTIAGGLSLDMEIAVTLSKYGNKNKFLEKNRNL